MANSPLGTVLTRLRTLLEPEEVDSTDRELLERFTSRGDEAAFGELVRRHGPMVLAVCRRVLGDAHAAEDAFQATFLVLVRRARAVPWRESLGGWLHGTARRVALQARRAAGVSRLIQQQSAGSRRPLAGPDPSEEAAARELRRVLDQELQSLSAKYRAPLVLCDLEGKTHEQAALELGWPKGSLAKRLTGGRERLRARLVRRGVTLSVTALAAVMAKEATAAPPVALAAAALLAAEGGASTAAAALAKGVVQAMWLTKIKTATVLILALAVTATLGGVGAYRVWGARAAAPAPAPNPPADENKDTDVMPVDKAVVYHVGPEQGVQTDDLPEGAAVVADRPESVDDNVHLYLAVNEKVNRQDRPVPVGPNQAILAVGPVLDWPDKAAVAGMVRRGDTLELNMAYTRAAVETEVVPARPWRPLVQVPIRLDVGRYHLKVNWQARKSLPDGETRGGPVGYVRDFIVTGGGRQEAKAVRLNGAEFRAFAEGRIDAPAVGGERPVDLGLRITNVSDKPLVFYNVAPLKVTTADGKELKETFSPAIFGRLRPKEIAVDPGKDLIPFFDASLQWTPDGKELQLPILDYEGNFRRYDDIKPGKYLLAAEYTLEKSPDPAKPFWTGTAKTEPVSFEVLEAPNTSKPVRVEGLEFTAFAPVHVSVSPPGGKTDVDFGLKIANVSNKVITVCTFDVIEPRLVAADGKELQPGLRARKDTPRVTPPQTLNPGESWTWRLGTSLSWTTDRTTLILSGPDGRGVAGAWSFPALRPGKYRLILEYTSTTTKYIDIPVWAGKAAAEPVDFEIVGP